MRRRTGVSLLIVFVCICCISFAFAKVEKEHTADIASVLGMDASNKSVELIGKAVALATDQGGEQQYNKLKEYLASDIPEYDDVQISYGSDHRKYGHLGWDSEYRTGDETNEDPKWNTKWKNRKKILSLTVEKALDIGWWEKLKGHFTDTQSDSFCALVYYIHLLGDHAVTNWYAESDRVMAMGGDQNKNDIINDLIYYCNVLFSDQSRNPDYIFLISSLQSLDAQYIKQVGTLNNDNIGKNKEIAEKTLKVLEKYIPNLLENEPFFQDGLAKAS